MRHMLLILLCVFCVSCAPKPFEPRSEIHDLSWERIDRYEDHHVELAKIKALGNFDIRPKMTSTNVILSKADYKKFAVCIEKGQALKTLAVNEADLVNYYIDIVNHQRSWMELERKKTVEYKELWVRAENAYLQEEYRHKRDNLVNKIKDWIILIGAIALGASSI